MLIFAYLSVNSTIKNNLLKEFDLLIFLNRNFKY
jgi:hypothetical protein